MLIQWRSSVDLSLTAVKPRFWISRTMLLATASFLRAFVRRYDILSVYGVFDCLKIPFEMLVSRYFPSF